MNQRTASLDLVERVERVARTVYRRYGLEAESAEIVGEGLLGLSEAALRHDSERGTELWTYAYARVRGRMVEHVRRMARNGRFVHRNLRYDEAEWESDGEKRAGVINPGVVSCDAGGTRGSNHSMESCMAERHVAILVARLLQKLPEVHRHVVVEVLINQRQVVEVANAMGEPHWRVRTILSQATRSLRRALNQEGYTFRELFGS